MSPQGCLSAFFLGLILVWSLVMGAFITAGWLGAEVIEFLATIFFADVEGARRASEGAIQFLRALGFGVFAAIWTIGVAILALIWFASLRGVRQVETVRQHQRIEIEVVNYPPGREMPGRDMKDVTPGGDDRGRPPEIPPPR